MNIGGKYPREVIAACGAAGVEPDTLLSWAVYPDRVVLIVASGAKVTVPVTRRAEQDGEKPVRVRKK